MEIFLRFESTTLLAALYEEIRKFGPKIDEFKAFIFYFEFIKLI